MLPSAVAIGPVVFALTTPGLLGLGVGTNSRPKVLTLLKQIHLEHRLQEFAAADNGTESYAEAATQSFDLRVHGPGVDFGNGNTRCRGDRHSLGVKVTALNSRKGNSECCSLLFLVRFGSLLGAF